MRVLLHGFGVSDCAVWFETNDVFGRSRGGGYMREKEEGSSQLESSS